MNTCEVPGCSKSVSKEGHLLCYDHWKAERAGKLHRCQRCNGWHAGNDALCPDCAKAAPGESHSDGASLSSTKIGDHFGLSNMKVNLILAELGWIERYVKGWIPTDRGNALGANVREARGTGVPYVVWPASILENKVLRKSVTELTGESKNVGSASADQQPASLQQWRLHRTASH